MFSSKVRIERDSSDASERGPDHFFLSKQSLVVSLLVVLSTAGCSSPVKHFSKSLVLGGKKVSARRLNN